MSNDVKKILNKISNKSLSETLLLLNKKEINLLKVTFQEDWIYLFFNLEHIQSEINKLKFNKNVCYKINQKYNLFKKKDKTDTQEEKGVRYSLVKHRRKLTRHVLLSYRMLSYQVRNEDLKCYSFV